jgi:hypothetical protein
MKGEVRQKSETKYKHVTFKRVMEMQGESRGWWTTSGRNERKMIIKM